MNDLTSKQQTVLLAQECTIYEVADLKEQLNLLIEDNMNINFDLSDVVLIDASVVQLLISIKTEMKVKELSFSIEAISQNAQEFISSIYCTELCVTNDAGEQNG